MPVNEKKNFPKNEQAEPELGEAKTVIDVMEMPPPDEIASLNIFGSDYYTFGRKDKASGAAALTLDEFIDGFCLRNVGQESHGISPSVLVQAHYEQYIAGYKGAAYHRLAFREIKT